MSKILAKKLRSDFCKFAPGGEQYCSTPGENLPKSERIFFAKILDILGHSSEFNRCIWLRFVQDKAKILKNVLPEAQLLENSVANVMRDSRSDV